MSEERKTVHLPADTEATSAPLSESEKRAQQVAQQKMAALEYATGYRQKLKEEKARRTSPAIARAKAEAASLKKEAEREERQRAIDGVLAAEKQEVQDRNAEADAVLNEVRSMESAKITEEVSPLASQPTPTTLSETTTLSDTKPLTIDTPEEKREPQSPAVPTLARPVDTESSPFDLPAFSPFEQTPFAFFEEPSLFDEPDSPFSRPTEPLFDTVPTFSASEKPQEKPQETESEQLARIQREAAEQVRRMAEKVAAERAVAQAAEAERRVATEIAKAAELARLAEEQKRLEETRLAEEKAQALAEEEKHRAEKQAAAVQKQEQKELSDAFLADAEADACRYLEAARRSLRQPATPVDTEILTFVNEDPLGLRAERNQARYHAALRLAQNKAGTLPTEPEEEPVSPIETEEPSATEAYTPVSTSIAFSDTPISVPTAAPLPSVTEEKHTDTYTAPSELPYMPEPLLSLENDPFVFSEETVSDADDGLVADASMDRDIKTRERAEKQDLRAEEKEARLVKEEERRAQKMRGFPQEEEANLPIAEEVSLPEEESDNSVISAEDVNILPAVPVDEHPIFAEEKTEEAVTEATSLNPKAIHSTAKKYRVNAEKSERVLMDILRVKKQNFKAGQSLEEIKAREIRKIARVEKGNAGVMLRQERVVDKARAKEAQAAKEVERRRELLNRADERLKQLEDKNAKKLAKHPEKEKQLLVGEERLSKSILLAHKKLDIACRKEQLAANKVGECQAALDRKQEKLTKRALHAEKKLYRVEKAAGKLEKKHALYNAKAERRLSKYPGAMDTARALEHTQIGGDNTVPLLVSLSDRQLQLEKETLQSVKNTEKNAAKAMRLMNTKDFRVERARRALKSAAKRRIQLSRNVMLAEEEIQRLEAQQQVLTEKALALMDEDPKKANVYTRREVALGKRLNTVSRQLMRAESKEEAFESGPLAKHQEDLDLASRRLENKLNAEARRLEKQMEQTERTNRRTDIKRAQRSTVETGIRAKNERIRNDLLCESLLDKCHRQTDNELRILENKLHNEQSRLRELELAALKAKQELDTVSVTMDVQKYKDARHLEKHPSALSKINKRTQKDQAELSRLQLSVEEAERKLVKQTEAVENAQQMLNNTRTAREAEEQTLLEEIEKTRVLTEQADILTALPGKTGKQMLAEAKATKKANRRVWKQELSALDTALVPTVPTSVTTPAVEKNVTLRTTAAEEETFLPYQDARDELLAAYGTISENRTKIEPNLTHSHAPMRDPRLTQAERDLVTERRLLLLEQNEYQVAEEELHRRISELSSAEPGAPVALGAAVCATVDADEEKRFCAQIERYYKEEDALAQQGLRLEKKTEAVVARLRKRSSPSLVQQKKEAEKAERLHLTEVADHQRQFAEWLRTYDLDSDKEMFEGLPTTVSALVVAKKETTRQRNDLRRMAQELTKQQKELAKAQAKGLHRMPSGSTLPVREEVPLNVLSTQNPLDHNDIPLLLDEKTLRKLDDLYVCRMAQEKKAASARHPLGETAALVEIQRNITNLYLESLHKCSDKTADGAKQLAAGAQEEIRVYNRYLQSLTQIGGTPYAPVSQEAVTRILTHKSYSPIKKIAAPKMQKAMRPVREQPLSDLPTGVLPQENLPTELTSPMTPLEYRSYAVTVKKSVADLKSEEAVLSRSIRKAENRHETLRLQTALIAKQKDVCELYNRLLTVGYENRYFKDAEIFRAPAVKEYRAYNKEIDTLRSLDGGKHTYADIRTPSLILSGKPIQDLPTVVCALPGKGGNSTLLTGSCEVDVALVTTRNNYRIRQMEETIRTGKYDFVLFNEAAKRTTQSKKNTLARMRAEATMAVQEEKSDNRRYDALLTLDPEQQTKNGKIKANETAKLQNELRDLLARRDDLNRELLSLYTMEEGKTALKAVEVTDTDLSVPGKDVPLRMQENGVVKEGNATLQSADLAYARLFEKTKEKHFRSQRKNVEKLNALHLPKDNADLRRLFDLYNRRVELLTRVDLTDDKIRLYHFHGKAAAMIRLEKKNNVRELSRISKEIAGRTKRVQAQAEQTAHFFG